MDRTLSNQAVHNFEREYVLLMFDLHFPDLFLRQGMSLLVAISVLEHLIVIQHLTHSLCCSKKATSRENPGVRPNLPVPDDPNFTMARFTSPGSEREDLGFRQTQTGTQLTARMTVTIKPLGKILRPN